MSDSQATLEYMHKGVKRVWPPPSRYAPDTFSVSESVIPDSYSYFEYQEDDLSASHHGCRSWRNGFWD